MNKRISIGAALTLIVIAMAVTVTLTMFFSQRLFNQKVSNLAEREAMYSKLAEVDKYIRSNELSSIDDTKISDGIIRGYLDSIQDEYAVYYTAAEYAEMQDALSGNTVGIGVVSRLADDGYIRVVSVYEDSPAQAAGIKTDDQIIRVDNLDVNQDTYDEAVASLNGGEVGTSVTLMVRRENEDLEVVCTRREIETGTVSTRIFNDTTGYIRISTFSSSTGSQFSTALTELRAAGINALVIDLRDCTGTSLESMASITDTLCPEGTLLSATYSNGTEKVLYRSTEGEVFLPIVILQNGNTSYCAEQMIAALMDYEKVKTVGTTTYGQFSLLETHKFSDGSAVVLSTAVLKSPNGETYNGTGIEPQIPVSGSGLNLDFVSLLDPNTDDQLAKALEAAESWSKTYNYPVALTSDDVG